MDSIEHEVTLADPAAESGIKATSSPLPRFAGVGSASAGAPGGPVRSDRCRPHLRCTWLASIDPGVVPVGSVTRQNPLRASDTQTRPDGSTRSPRGAVTPLATTRRVSADIAAGTAPSAGPAISQRSPMSATNAARSDVRHLWCAYPPSAAERVGSRDTRKSPVEPALRYHPSEEPASRVIIRPGAPQANSFFEPIVDGSSESSVRRLPVSHDRDAVVAAIARAARASTVEGVRLIGVDGPSGAGKSTIATFCSPRC